MAKFAPHMSDPHADPQTSPQHADPHAFVVLFFRAPVHADQRVVSRHVDHPCGGQISQWTVRKVTESWGFLSNLMTHN